MNYSVIVAGSTERTLQCAQALEEDSRFTLTGVITPAPKLIGRKQVLTKNPLHVWAEKRSIPSLLIEKKIDAALQQKIRETFQAPALLLVVDFGYIVPQWLLDFPSIAPVNIHPSELPKYRGSSPGQFALAFGEKKSAVTVMKMDALLDHGPILTSIPFDVPASWTTPDYYTHAFSLVTKQLASILSDYCSNAHESPQPDKSPTPTARMLTRDDGFIPFETLERILQAPSVDDVLVGQSIPFLSSYSKETTGQALYDLWRGFSPWPGLWTRIEEKGTQKRMKLLSFHLDGEKLLLDDVQVEGETPKKYNSA